MNNTDLKLLKVPRQELESMSDDQALEFAMKDPTVENFMKGWKAVNVKLHVEQGCDGYVQIVTKKDSQEISQ